MSMAESLNRDEKSTQKGHFTIGFTDNNSVVLCKVYGYISRATIEKIIVQCQLYTNTLAAQGKPTLLAFDISRVSGSSADARSAVGLIGNYKVDRCAVYGGNAFLMLLVRYVSRLGGKHNTLTFRTRRGALSWLHGRQQNARIWSARVISTLVTLFGLATLAGWVANIDIFRAPNSTATSLAVAACLAVSGASVVLLTLRFRINKALAVVGAAATGLLGLAAIARWVLGVATPLDSWFISQITPPTALAFTFFSAAFIVVCSGLKPKRIRDLLYNVLIAFATATTAVSLLATNISSSTLRFPSEYLALLMLIMSLSLVVRDNTSKFPVVPWLITRYWQSVAVFIALFIGALSLWQQAASQGNADTLGRAVDVVNAQVTDDLEVLQSFKAFFDSSDFVTPAEFSNFFTESGASKKYSGITHLGYLRNTGSTAKPSYPLTYTTPEITPDSYADLAARPDTLALLNKARDEGRPIASSDTKNYPLGKEQNKEVFVALAIYKPDAAQPTTVEERRQQLRGFIVAEFDYYVFFQNLAREFPDLNSAVLVVTDPHDPTRPVYESPQAAKASRPVQSNSRPINIAQHTWNISLLRQDLTPADLLQNPGFILSGGAAVSLLIALLIASLIRRRQQALALAETITEDLETEHAQALETAQKVEAILASIGDGLIVTDAKGQVLLVNDRFCDMFKIHKSGVEGKLYDDVVRMVDKQGKPIPAKQNCLHQALKNNQLIDIGMNQGCRYVRNDGSLFPTASTITPITNMGRMVGVVEVIRDVSVEAKIDQAKTEFVSLASHQLRTPLTAAKWYSELLLHGDAGKLSSDQEAYMREVYAATNRTIKLVSALLNLSRVEMGSVAVEPEPTDVPALAHDVVHELSKQISQRMLNMKEFYSPDSFEMNVDPRLVRIMIENLLTNAIKYTPEKGQITLKVGKYKDGLLIEVSDTGYGIPKDQQANIFTKLFRADNIRKKSAEGVGLGLYLVKSIVEYLGGKIWFDSVENEGTTFHIRLPAHGMKKKTGKQIQ